MMQKPMLAALLSFEGHYLNDQEKKLFAKHNPAGFNFFPRNIKDKEQIKETIKQIKEVLERDDIIFAVDQEGGRVRRLTEPEFRSYLPQYALSTEEITKEHAYLISSDLKDLGFNMNYAPVIDIARENTTSSLKSRCFPGGKEEVAKLAKAMISEYLKCGISPCIKHMPGHGLATVDPHLSLPTLNYSLKELEVDFYPFIKNNTSPAGMTAHIIIPEVDPENPITQSKKAIDYLIRKHIGFDGLLISDAIDMKALKGTAGEKAKAAHSAGCDVICYALGIYDELVDVCTHCGTMNDRSLERFAKIVNITKHNPNFDNIEKIAKSYKTKAGTIKLYDETYDATEVLSRMKKE